MHLRLRGGIAVHCFLSRVAICVRACARASIWHPSRRVSIRAKGAGRRRGHLVKARLAGARGRAPRQQLVQQGVKEEEAADPGLQLPQLQEEEDQAAVEGGGSGLAGGGR